MAIPSTEKRISAWRSPWVWAFLGLFAVVLAVNLTFISLSTGTNPGLVTEEYYRYGLQRNKIGEQYRQQAERGWQLTLAPDQDWQLGKPVRLLLTAEDSQGRPLSGGQGELSCYRPSDAKADLTYTLSELADAGKYAATIVLPAGGYWDISLLFKQGDDKHMLTQRIEVAGGHASGPSPLDRLVRFLIR